MVTRKMDKLQLARFIYVCFFSISYLVVDNNIIILMSKSCPVNSREIE